MKNLNGALAHKRGVLKSIVLVMLVFITKVTVGCSSDKSQKTVADIGGTRGQEIRKESAKNSISTDIGGKNSGTIQFSDVLTTADIGGGKSIKGDFSTVTDIGGGKSTNGTLQISKSVTVHDIGGKSSNVGQISFAISDIGGKNDTSTGNLVAALKSYIVGGGDVVVIKLTSETVAFDIGGGGKGTSTTLLV